MVWKRLKIASPSQKLSMDVSIISLRTQAEAAALMKEIGVDPGGIGIMAPKAVSLAARVSSLPIFAANILKQETLSIGADTAVSRDALTGKAKHTDCLIIGSLAHIGRLCEKLKRQPYGLSRVAVELLSKALNCQRDVFALSLASRRLDLSLRTHIMGIINITPDSFSGDGLLRVPGSGIRDKDIVDYAKRLADEGADILDLGGESSRPGAKTVPLKEELSRVIPAIKEIRRKLKVPISVDTCKSEVARQALDNGADIINDITALNGDIRMAGVIKKYNAAVVLMHMKGRPRTMQKKPSYRMVMDDVAGYLESAIKKALGAGVDFEKIIVDPGIGFGKTAKHNLKIINSLGQLKALGRPILIGLSRKSFIGAITGEPVGERLAATISGNCLAVAGGAKIVRVHDVRAAKSAFKVADRILKCR